jgi:methyltransferase (TIGR00027 family)
MEAEQPSHTAQAAAAHRAVHQILEHGRIFNDPLAVLILGEDPDTLVRRAESAPSSRRMRLFIAVRAHFAEASVVAAVERGVRQLVILGAGLDTFAYRNPFGDRVRIFEVDHPATQAWKRERLAGAGIRIPESLALAPIGFERQSLAEGLSSAGFDSIQQTFFTWLGVVPYLKQEAVFSTLAFIGSLAHGAHVVFDYSDPPDTLPPDARALYDRRAARVHAAGEAWVSHFEPHELRATLQALRFSEIEDLGPREIAARYFPVRSGTVHERGGHIVRASSARR